MVLTLNNLRFQVTYQIQIRNKGFNLIEQRLVETTKALVLSDKGFGFVGGCFIWKLRSITRGSFIVFKIGAAGRGRCLSRQVLTYIFQNIHSQQFKKQS